MSLFSVGFYSAAAAVAVTVLCYTFFCDNVEPFSFEIFLGLVAQVNTSVNTYAMCVLIHKEKFYCFINFPLCVIIHLFVTVYILACISCYMCVNYFSPSRASMS